MYWKLRIHLFFFVLGTLSGLIQKFPEIFREGFFFLLGILFIIFVKAKMMERKVHFSIGIGLILLGIMIDLVTM
jgi:hypothetical protein